jgi:hypothetical protein
MDRYTAGGRRHHTRIIRALGGAALAAVLAFGAQGALNAQAHAAQASSTEASNTQASNAQAAAAALAAVRGVTLADPGSADPTSADPTSPTTAGQAATGARHLDPLRPLALAAEFRYADEGDKAEPAVQAPAPTQAPTPAPASTPKPAKTTTTASVKVSSSSVVLRAYQFTFPAIGIKTQSSILFGCNASGSLANRLYRWGCASGNNTYLLGHAYGVFKPLNSAYHSGALKVGQVAYYAGADGVTRTYRVTEIRHVKMADWASWGGWAKGSLSRPGLTLQTCDGAGDVYRIVVRLMAV